MTMLTRCPHCDTVFRVLPQQLQKQHGQVRCGHCMQVFDGFRTLSSEADRTPVEPVAQRAAEVAPPPGIPTPDPKPAPVEPVLSPVASAAVTPPAAAPVSKPEPQAAPEEDLFEDALPARTHGYAWGVASILLLIVLLAQAAYLYRVELAANVPGLKPALARACEALRCTVPLPQQPKLISIEASDLQVPDSTRPGVIQLTATLRSHAQYDVAYPALDLVLTNAQEHTLARRIFAPREYLTKARDPALGIPPNAEVTLQLDLDTGDLGASGFRLDLLPAPS
ncbi:MAG TPA: zinc-ribbon and DUF3426 domain-containing protein [Burkholderiales bacterium]|nr:zinc-ribbon and DUF3426 domain-containing protein [Burkholderiales bacterium]